MKENLSNCGMCHLVIRHVDDYVKVEDYIKGQLKLTSYHHRICFRDRLSSVNESINFQKKAKEIIIKMEKLLFEDKK